MVQLGADIAARTDDGETPLKTSIRTGHHQVAQVLRELESTARTQQAAARERAVAYRVFRSISELIGTQQNVLSGAKGRRFEPCWQTKSLSVFGGTI